MIEEYSAFLSAPLDIKRIDSPMTLEHGQTRTTYVEFAAFTAQHPDQRFELIEGMIVEKTPTALEYRRVAARLVGELYLWQSYGGIGVGGLDARIRIWHDQYNVRQPDFSLFTRQIELIPNHGGVPRMPDFVMEIQSPMQRFTEIQRKAHYYLENGARMVWLVRPEKRVIEVCMPDDLWMLGEGDILDGGDILPGFTLPIADVFNGYGAHRKAHRP